MLDDVYLDSLLVWTGRGKLVPRLYSLRCRLLQAPQLSGLVRVRGLLG